MYRLHGDEPRNPNRRSKFSLAGDVCWQASGLQIWSQIDKQAVTDINGERGECSVLVGLQPFTNWTGYAMCKGQQIKHSKKPMQQTPTQQVIISVLAAKRTPLVYVRAVQRGDQLFLALGFAGACAEVAGSNRHFKSIFACTFHLIVV